MLHIAGADINISAYHKQAGTLIAGDLLELNRDRQVMVEPSTLATGRSLRKNARWAWLQLARQRATPDVGRWRCFAAA